MTPTSSYSGGPDFDAEGNEWHNDIVDRQRDQAHGLTNKPLAETFSTLHMPRTLKALLASAWFAFTSS